MNNNEQKSNKPQTPDEKFISAILKARDEYIKSIEFGESEGVK